jgi:type IV pilus assembly protein PilA
MNRENGFSLIELLVVIAIILVISAISIPALLQSRIAANEANACASLRTVDTAQTTYSINYPQVGFADDMKKLGPPSAGGQTSAASADLVDWVIGCASQPCLHNGYYFSIGNIQTGGGMVTSYTAWALPAHLKTTGNRGFCSGPDLHIMSDPNGGTDCTENVPQ